MAGTIRWFEGLFRIGKYDQSWFYIEYSIYTHVLVLYIEGCEFFRKCMSDATNNNSFGSVLTATNDVGKCIYYIIDGIYFFFYQSYLIIEALTVYKNITQ